MLEVVPSESLLAAIDDDAELAGNPHAAEKLSHAGMVVDADWPALDLGPVEPTLSSRLAGRPRFTRLAETVNRVGEKVNRVSDRLPLHLEVPEWRPERRTVLFRATLPTDPEAAARALSVANEESRIVGIFNDPQVTLAARRPRDPAHGTVEQVADLMGVADLRQRGLDGDDVTVVVVDGGINMEYLRDRGRRHELDTDLSWVIEGSHHSAGEFPTAHGTMTAFQVGIAAPEARIADHAVLIDRADDGEEPLIKAWLSDIEPGYVHLHQHLSELDWADRRLVISNSWAMTSPKWDFPATDPDTGAIHPENFSINPNHPFNRMVRALVDEGADVLFSAGNCGRPHPVRKCEFDKQPICGANSLEEVITVGAVDVNAERLGYSSQGPGRIVARKPDLCGYSHYKGSDVFYADWGTSTACPGVAGVVAAVRSQYSAADLSPAHLKEALLASARPGIGGGHSPEVGYGVVDPVALLRYLP